MKPYYDADGMTIYHGDCRDVLPELPKIALVLTDPPYGTATFVQRPCKYQRLNGMVPQSWDDSRPLEIVQILPVVAPKVVIWGGNFYPLPTSRGWLCWHKPNSAVTFGQFELAWTNLDMIPKIFTYPMGMMRMGNGHPTEKPLPLIKWTLASVGFSEGLILDPFMGSGTTLRAAKDMGLQAIGIEIEERYCEIAAKRLRQGVLDFGEINSDNHQAQLFSAPARVSGRASRQYGGLQ
jgi:site-specific DNA-methyltransferase (adenine-specific)